MNHDALNGLKQFFSTYADRYIRHSKTPAPLVLKRDHTQRVCREVLDLGLELGLCPNDLRLAETMALFHDLGRFRQYDTYGTFLDQQSENHARLSLREIHAHDVFQGVSREESRLMRKAIALHNVAELPRLADERLIFFTRLLRDADKLDIWRVVIENYTTPRPGSEQAVNLGLEDDNAFSPDAVQAIQSGTLVKSHTIRRLNDLKLMQISWVFDLNFLPTFKRVKARHYIEKIAATLPTDIRVHQAIEKVRRRMETAVAPNPTTRNGEQPVFPSCAVSQGAVH